MRAAIAVMVVMFIAFGVLVQAQEETVPRYEPLDECFVEIPDGIAYDCGNVIVPEFHEDDTGRTLTLGVVRLLASSENPAEPIFLGAGGPGGSVIGQSVTIA